MRRLPAWCSLLSCVALALHAPARAQGPDTSASSAAAPVLEAQQKEQARLLFNEGLEFVEREDWAGAESRFRSVLLLRASHVVAYNLASALSHLERLMEASELLRAIVRDDMAEAGVRSAAQQLLAEIEQRIGTLTLRIAGDSAGAVVRLDGAPLELSEQLITISVDPGVHDVVVERDGAHVASETVRIGGDAPLQVAVTLSLPPRILPSTVAQAAQPVRASGPSTTGARTAPSHGPRDEGGGDSILESWWFWGAVGVVAAGGVVTGLALAGGGDPAPLRGDTDPAVLSGTVRAMP